MDPLGATAAHITDLISNPPGPKALLLDDETSRILSLVTPHSTLLQHSVLLIQKLPATSSALPLPCAALLRPTAENVHSLRSELNNPRFTSYRIFFTNTVRRSLIEELADADAESKVVEVREVFVDFFALDSHLLSANVVPCLANMRNVGLERFVDAILSALVAMRRRPRIRYERGSMLCKTVGERVAVKVDQETGLFEFGKEVLVLIMDRREDPVTPLLNQWTYEAMVHEMIGIEFNRVKVGGEVGEVVVGDEFWRKYKYASFGELGERLDELVRGFRRKNEGGGSSIEEMVRFVQRVPELRKEGGIVGVHVGLGGVLSQRVREGLLEISEIEQDLACREAEGEHRKMVLEMLERGGVDLGEKLRLVMLYGLRYEGKDVGMGRMKEILKREGVGTRGLGLIEGVREYAGVRRRQGDLFENKSLLAVASSRVRRMGGVENVYMQHEPLLMQTLNDLFRGKLSAEQFVSTRNGVMENEEGGFVAGMKDVLIVMAGGVTYEEAKCVSAINGGGYIPPEGSLTANAKNAAAGGRVILLGSCVHNSTTFAVEIAKNVETLQQRHFT